MSEETDIIRRSWTKQQLKRIEQETGTKAVQFCVAREIATSEQLRAWWFDLSKQAFQIKVLDLIADHLGAHGKPVTQ